MNDETEIDASLQLKSKEVYGIIAPQGKDELARPLSSLAWSGITAGIAISFSLFFEAYFQLHLGDAKQLT